MTTASGHGRMHFTTFHRGQRAPADRMADTDADLLRGGGSRVPRTRGAVSGVMLMILGAWGALAPFIGPYFNFGLSPNQEWYWSSARGWLMVLPGAAAFVAGLLLTVTASRAVANLAAWLAILAGAWFIVGPTMQSWLNIGSPGDPLGESETKQMLETLTFLSGLGALILFFGATAFGRLSVRSVRDVRAAREREARAAAMEQAQQPYAAGAPAAHTSRGGDEALVRERDDMPVRERDDMAVRDRDDMPVRERDDMAVRDRDDMTMHEEGAPPRDEATMLDRDAGRMRRADEPPAWQNPPTR